MHIGPWDAQFEALLRQAITHLPDGQIDPAFDLPANGLDSMAAVQLLLEVEAAYEISIPDELLTKAIFATPASLWDAVANLRLAAA